MSNDRQQDFPIAEQAARWTSVLPAASANVRRDFVRWLKQSPMNVREMLFASALDLELGRHDPQRNIDINALATPGNNVTQLMPEKRGAKPEIVANSDAASNFVADENKSGNSGVTGSDDKPPPRGWKSSSWLIGIAAAASILALALGWPGIIEGIGLTEQYLTETGEQRTIPLADSSVIHMNTESSVRVVFSEKARDIYLDKGQATFDVAHDASRPFRVHVNQAVVQAIGTQFDVDRRMNHIDVAVLEGRVKVTAGRAKQAATADVSAGKGVRIAADGSVSPPIEISAASVLAWRERRLMFRNETLANIAAEFNRYNKAPKIRVDGEPLQGKRFSGVFDANDPESFLQVLAVTDRQLAFDRDDEQFVVIRLRSSYALLPAGETKQRAAVAN